MFLQDNLGTAGFVEDSYYAYAVDSRVLWPCWALGMFPGSLCAFGIGVGCPEEDQLGLVVGWEVWDRGTLSILSSELLQLSMFGKRC